MIAKSNTGNHRTQTAQQARPIDCLPAIFLAAALFFLPTRSESGTLNSLAIVFISIVLEAIPFMFFGSLVGGLVEAFVRRERMAMLLPKKRWLIVCVAAGAGIVFPVCECAVVPVVRRLVGKGLPLSAAIAYLLGGPIVNPIVAASTALAYAFDWHIVILRLAMGYGIAVLIGLVMGRLFSSAKAIKEHGITADQNTPSYDCRHHPTEGTQTAGCCTTSENFPKVTTQTDIAACGCGGDHPMTDQSWTDKVGSAFNHAMDDFLAVGHYLVIGAFIAALAQTYIERSSFLSVAGTPILSVALMMALAILLNLCSEADAFIAASFQGLMPVPAQMAFLLTGPMFDLKLLLMYQSVFRRRAIIVLASLVLIVVLVFSVGLELLNGISL
ncbi:MAG: permease [Desulfobacteraceae bacterium]|jgi:hypothetical protein